MSRPRTKAASPFSATGRRRLKLDESYRRGRFGLSGLREVSRPSGSFAIPLNGPGEDLRSMNSPLRSLRFCQSPLPCWTCVRPVTAPVR